MKVLSYYNYILPCQQPPVDNFYCGLQGQTKGAYGPERVRTADLLSANEVF